MLLMKKYLINAYSYHPLVWKHLSSLKLVYYKKINYICKKDLLKYTTMKDTPSYNGIGSRSKTVLRTTRKETENSVTTQRPAPSTPSPRGHA